MAGKNGYKGPIKCRPLPPLSEINRIYRYDKETGIFYHVGDYRDGEEAGQFGFSGSYGKLEFDKRKFGNPFAAHRIAWKIVYGKNPRGVIDHINGIRDDNRIVNLRDITQSENSKNNHGSLWSDELKRRKEHKIRHKLEQRTIRRHLRKVKRAAIYNGFLGFAA